MDASFSPEYRRVLMGALSLPLSRVCYDPARDLWIVGDRQGRLGLATSAFLEDEPDPCEGGPIVLPIDRGRAPIWLGTAFIDGYSIEGYFDQSRETWFYVPDSFEFTERWEYRQGIECYRPVNALVHCLSWPACMDRDC